MDTTDVVKVEMTDFELCKKFPSDDLQLGIQIEVCPGQAAYFVKGNQVYDRFEAGTYTLATENIPLLNGIMQLPADSVSPFHAEIWFVNLAPRTDLKWGTVTPIQVEDPKYHISVPVRGYGYYGFKVIQPELFLTTLVTTMPSFTPSKVNDYFKGRMMSSLNNTLGTKIGQDGFTLLEAGAHLDDMSLFCREKINKSFGKYGLQADFSFVSVNMPQNDPAVIRLIEAKEQEDREREAREREEREAREREAREKAEREAREREAKERAEREAKERAEREAREKAEREAREKAEREAREKSAAQTPPPLPPSATYFIYVNGQQMGDQTLETIAALINQGIVRQDTLVWRNGLPNWVKAVDLPEIAPLFLRQTPPPIPPQF